MSEGSRRSVVLRWSGEGLRFVGGPPGGPETVVDGDGAAGPAPMQLLLLSLAGCMAIDVRLILEKSRVPLEAMTVEATGVRAEEDPRRYVQVELVYRLTGPGEADEGKIQRAVDLSRERYCSVLHTLAPDLDLEIRFQRG